MHEDGKNSREFKCKFRAGNQHITTFETFQWKYLKSYRKNCVMRQIKYRVDFWYF